MIKQRFSCLLILLLSLVSLSACNAQNTMPDITEEGVSMAMKQIWQIEDPDELIIALGNHIAQKCQYGQSMASLSEPERVFFITQSLEMEVNNGGFSQFFYNSSGDFSGELVASFTAIGAEKTAAICQQALSAFGQELPTDRAARVNMLENCDSDEIEEALAACDDAFYEYQDDLNTLNYTYVLKHKESFT